MDVKLIKKAYEEARNAFRELQSDSADADLAGNDADAADVIPARLEAHEKRGKTIDNEEEEWGGIGGNDEDGSNDQEEEDPSSFSGIPPSGLHTHLNLPTTTGPPFSSRSPSSFIFSFKSAGPSFIVILKGGEMLYLPASEWYKVTSSSSSHPIFTWHSTTGPPAQRPR